MSTLKRLLMVTAFVFSCGGLFAQTTAPSEPTQNPAAPYRLFRTTNLWTFIELETATGRMWQVHFSLQAEGRGEVVLNAEDLLNGKKKVAGRFTLYPTQNMYNFILLDQIDGGTWQVQWSFDKENRVIVPIGE